MNLIWLTSGILFILFIMIGLWKGFNKKYCISTVTTIVLFLLLIFTGLFPVKIGKCGKNAWFSYNIYNTATIYGSGKIALYNFDGHHSVQGADGKYIDAKTNLVPEKLKKVIIGKGINELDTEAFAHYKNLETVKFSNTVSSIGSDAFAYCENLKEINLTDNINFIGESAFMKCTSLKEIVIPNNVTQIKFSTFSSCEQLSEVTLNKNITDIDWAAFANCKNLKRIEFPNNLKVIGREAFQNCTALEEITIPENVTKIDDYAFYGCKNLKKINVSENNPNYTSVDGVLYNKEKDILICYPAGKDDAIYTVSNTVKEIDTLAFANCINLKTLNIEAKTLFRHSIYCCDSIEIINLTDKVEKIDSSEAIHNCPNLKEFNVSSNIIGHDLAEKWKNEIIEGKSGLF